MRLYLAPLHAALALNLPLLFTAWLRPDVETGVAWIPLAIMAASMIGNYLSKKSEGAAKGRMVQADLQNEQDRTLTDQYGIAQNAETQAATTDLARKNFSEDARGNRARQAVTGDMLANWSPTQISVPGIKTAEISGGLQGKLGTGAQMAGQLLNQQALMKMLNGDTFEGGQRVPPPGVQSIPKASGWEKWAGILGSIGTGIGTAGQVYNAAQGGGGGMSGDVPGVPYQSGLPSTIPGVQQPTPGLPDNAALQDYLATIKHLTNQQN